jgi:hypothetical protein
MQLRCRQILYLLLGNVCALFVPEFDPVQLQPRDLAGR